jgi:hypothetical protein
LIAFFTTLVLKIAPIYINHSRVLNSLNAIKNKPNIEKKSKYAIFVFLKKSFNINYVEKVQDDDITIIKNGPFYLRLEIEYEVIEPIFGNLSVLVEFYDVIEVGEQ